MGRQKLTVTMLALVCLSLSLGFAAGQTCNGLGAMCWSTATGVTAGGCCAGTQCSPWLPSGGTWDGSSPWYCLSLPTLADGATCDYTNFVGLCASGSCTNGVCGGSTTAGATTTAAATTAGATTTTAAATTTTTAACTAQGRDICNDSTYPDLYPLECCSPYTCTEIEGGVSQCTGTNLQAGDTCWSSTTQPLSAGTCGSGLYCDPTTSTCVADNPSCAETGVLGGYNRCYSGVLHTSTVPCCDSYPAALCQISDDPADNGDGFCMPANLATGAVCGKTSATSYAGSCDFTGTDACVNGVCGAATTTTTVTTTTVTTTTVTTTTVTAAACIASSAACFDPATGPTGNCCSGFCDYVTYKCP